MRITEHGIFEESISRTANPSIKMCPAANYSHIPKRVQLYGKIANNQDVSCRKSPILSPHRKVFVYLYSRWRLKNRNTRGCYLAPDL
jgi:ferredoxin-like protein FixX